MNNYLVIPKTSKCFSNFVFVLCLVMCCVDVLYCIVMRCGVSCCVVLFLLLCLVSS